MTLVTATRLEIAGRLSPTDIDLRAGELACLVGPNGSGKTSLLHALAGIGAPLGDVRIDGFDPKRARPGERGRLLAYLPASRDVHWPLSARAIIALGLPGGENAEAVDRVLERLELGGLAHRRVDRLSTGERSRVLIARALAGEAKLLLLDEPAANLDPLWQLRLMAHLRALAAVGQAVLAAMHDLDIAARFADRMIVMADGTVAFDGSPAEMLAGPVIRQVFGIEKTGGAWYPLT